MVKRKSTRFSELLRGDRLRFLMEAHNGLSAAIVEEAGFEGIWASGLCMSAALGVRDNNEASWTQVLEVLEFMSDASSVPILVDADTGYGNFNNARRLVRKLEQRQIAAMCIEDKLFPKTNSFIGGEQQPLAPVDEFCGKIMAAKDSQTDPDFSVVARVEAFIAGWGLDEALRRAEAYHEAGADAILMHSKEKTPHEVLAFLREWGDRGPVILVPTTYYKTPTPVFEQAGARMLIWANQVLRASVVAMQQAAGRIHAARSLEYVEDEIASVKEIFRLQRADELKGAEKRYLPERAAPRAVLVSGEPRVQPGSLLQRQVASLNAAGVKDVVALHPIRTSRASGTAVRVLEHPRDAFDGTVLLCAPDVLLREHVVQRLLAEPGEIVAAVESDLDAETPESHMVRCSEPASRALFDRSPALLEFSDKEPHGEWIGVVKLGPRGARLARALLEQDSRSDRGVDLRTLLADLIAHGELVDVAYVNGHWQRFVQPEPQGLGASPVEFAAAGMPS